MCNVHIIIALKSKLNKNDILEFLRMLKTASKRNEDGFGLFNEKNEIFKSRYKYNNRFDKRIIKKFLSSKFIIGHNRWATSGKVMKGNSHPFYNKRFIWVHNGMIYNKEEISHRYDINCDVDSELIGEVLHKKIDFYEKLGKDTDLIEIMKETFKELGGMFSIFIFDKKTKKLYYVKHNAEFTLCLFKLKNGKLRIIGSTEDSNLVQPYHRNFFGFRIGDSEVLSDFMIRDDVLYSIDEKNGVELICDVDFKEMLYSSYYRNGVYHEGYGDFENGLKVFKGSQKQTSLENIEPLEENLQNFFNDSDISVIPSKKTVLINCKKSTVEEFKYNFNTFLVKDCKELRIRYTMLSDFRKEVIWLLENCGTCQELRSKYPAY